MTPSPLMLPYKFLMPELLDSRGLKLCRKDTNPNPVLEMDFEILEINASFTNTTRKELFACGMIELNLIVETREIAGRASLDFLFSSEHGEVENIYSKLKKVFDPAIAWSDKYFKAIGDKRCHMLGDPTQCPSNKTILNMRNLTNTSVMTLVILDDIVGFFPMGIIESKSSSKDSFNTLRPGSGLIFRRTFNKPNLIECSMKKYCGKHLEDTADDILRIARRNNWLKMDESTKRQISELRKSMYRPVFGTFFKTMGFDFCCRDSYNSRISFLRSMLGLFHKNRFLADFESVDASQPIPEPLNLPYTSAQGRNAQVGSFDDCSFTELDMDESIEILEPFACPTSADCSNFK